jgi:predicted metal-binding transcription factor (methanogenesis marker protein 9)
MVDKPQKRPFYSHIWCCSNNLFDIISDHDMILARNDFCPEEKREKRKEKTHHHVSDDDS